jgi:hypothetical protein
MNPLRHYRPGSLVVANIGTDYAATTRYAMVEQGSQHDESLCLVDCNGRELTGEIVSLRSMTEAEALCFECSPDYDRAVDAADPDVFERCVMVLLAAARGRRVVDTTGEEVRGAA